MSLALETELKEFLRQPKNDADGANPPTLPPHLGNLPDTIYVTAALEYLDCYNFDRTHTVVSPQGRAEYDFVPSMHPGWDEKARSYLKACVEVDRSSLASLSQNYDANQAQQQFIHEELFKRRWALEEFASEAIALVELVRSETRIPSAVTTPMTSEQVRARTVVDKVRLRDENCRLSGVIMVKKRTPEEQRQINMSGLLSGHLEVTHGLPFKMGETSFKLVEMLTGIPAATWGESVDCVENALLMQHALHKLFGAFSLYFESGPNNSIYIRARMSPEGANPIAVLRAINNVEGRPCHSPSALIDTQLRSPNLHTIADIDMKFFTLHKFIGDIAWMCGGADPDSDDEDEDEDEWKRVLSADNWPVLQEKLAGIEHFDATHAGTARHIYAPQEHGSLIASAG